MDLVTNGSRMYATMLRLSIFQTLLVTNVIFVKKFLSLKNLLKIIDPFIIKDWNKHEGFYLFLYCLQILFKTLQICFSLLQRIQIPRNICAPFVMDLATTLNTMFAIMWNQNIFQKHSFTSVTFVTWLWEQNKLLNNIEVNNINKDIDCWLRFKDLWTWGALDFKYWNFPGSLQDPSDFLQYVDKDSDSKKYFCNICHGFSHRGRINVRNHVESKHFPETFIYKCDICDMTLRTKQALEQHRSQQHKGFSKYWLIYSWYKIFIS